VTIQPFVLSAFTMSTASHGNFGLWRHPDDRTSEYTNLRYWTELAALLDAGGFDLLFIADAVGQLDVFGDGHVGGLGGFGGELFVGSGATVASELEAYAERSGVDGFNIAYHVTPGSFRDVAEHLIPELRRRGRAADAGEPVTLRQRIFGHDSIRLPDDHPAAGYRR
jgi:alkanesulfonate monooxygenase SsuD/methylene tetrahydromethanopterin reductase-like flavin-dependent oxidoreductase (luciferase family)